MSTKQLSIILLDNSARERFHTLDWLAQQDVAREHYELIWMECYDRVSSYVLDRVDQYYTMQQEGLHHKHAAVNAGIVAAKGRIVTMCDSDAVYPPDFVRSILNAFEKERIVLMHWEERSRQTYPDGASLALIQKHTFDVWPNVGACNSVLRRDAIGIGGVDEHESYKGILAGQNEMLWRLINSGVPEVWCDTPHIYHFKHTGSDGDANASERHPASRDYEMHNATSVEAFKEGRLLPLVENKDIHRLRMEQRIIGTDLERKYAWYPH